SAWQFAFSSGLMNRDRSSITNRRETRENGLNVDSALLVNWDQIKAHRSAAPGVQGQLSVLSELLILEIHIENPGGETLDRLRSVLLSAQLQIGGLVNQPEV